MNVRPLALTRLVVAGVAIAALLTGLWRAVEAGFDAINYVSFFTFQTTTIAAAVLIVTALHRSHDRPHWLDWWRGASAVYVTVTFVVVIVLLEGRFGWDDWTDFVTHKLLPVAVVTDFLLDPPRNRLSTRDALAFVSYGIVWLGYAFVRGAATGWYPYPFLDPAVVGVALATATTALIVVAGAVLGIFYVRVAGRLAGRHVVEKASAQAPG